MNKREKDYWHSRMNAVIDDNVREKEVARIYSSQYREIEKKILNLYDKAVSGSVQRSDLYKLKHYQDVISSIEKQNKEIKKSLKAETLKTLKGAYKGAFKEVSDMLDASDKLTEQRDEMLSGVIKTKWSGDNWSRRIWKNTDYLSGRIKADVVTSIVSGASRDTLVKTLMDDYNVGFSDADRLIRTETAHCVNQAQLDIYKRDGIEYVEWSAGKDERMCKVCGRLHGKRFKVSEAPSIAHPRCRCTLIPVIPDNWTADKKPKPVDKSSESGIIKESEKLSELGKFKEKIRNDSSMSKEYYATVKKKFSHGSDFAKTAFNKFVPDNSVIDSAFEGTAMYNTRTKKISMHYGADLNNPRGACITYFHEHGHLIDDVAGNLSKDKMFRTLLEEDTLLYRKAYGKSHGLKTIDKVDKAISKELNSMRKHSGVSDILDSLTGGNISGVAGHSTDYWEKEGNLEAEAFAHMFASQFDKVRYAEMKKYFPQSLEWFENKLKEAVK